MTSLNKPSKALCIYCYKSATQNYECRNSIKVHTLFLNLISRHLKDGKSILLVSECLHKPCNDCLRLLTNFCELYHQLKCLELQLNWQVGKLWNVMRWADRVPSRLKEFRNTGDFQRKFEFRKIFKEKCKQHFAKQLPRVGLPLHFSGLSKTEIPVETLGSSQEDVSFEVVFEEISIGNDISSNNNEDRDQQEEQELVLPNPEPDVLAQVSLKPQLSGGIPCDGTGSNSDYQESQQSPCNTSVNHNDSKSKLSSCVNDVIIQVQEEEEVSLPVFQENTQFPNAEIGLTCQYEDATTTVNEPMFLKIKSESHSKELGRPPVASPESQVSPNIEIGNIDVKLVPSLPADHCFYLVFPMPSSSTSFPSHKRVLPEEADGEERQISTRRSLRTKLQCSNCKRTFSDRTRFTVHSSFCNQSIDKESDSTDTEDEDEINVKVKSEIEIYFSKITTHVGRTNYNNLNREVVHDSNSSSSSDEVDDDFVKEKGNQWKSLQRKLYSCSKCIPPKTYNSKIHDIYKHSNGHSRLNAQNMHRLNLTHNSVKLDGISLEFQYQCTSNPNQCSKKYPLSKELENHTKLHGKFTCQICDLCYTQVLDLIHHELEHSDEKQLAADKRFEKGEIFHCARCEYKTGFNADIMNHYLKAHFGLPEIEAKCPICQQTFLNKDTIPLTHYINYHDLNRLDDPGEMVKCDERDCHAYFLTEDQLHVHCNREHMSLKAKHIQENKDIRIKTYKSEQKLKSKPISCTFCPKKFSHQTFLRMHILVQHVKESGFKNAEVKKGKRIITKEGLTVDDIVLEKNAKYFCKINNCKEKFRNEEDFQSHSKLHGEFPCNFCETVSKFASDLAIHEIVHVKNEIEVKRRSHCQRVKFRCSRCPFVTGWKEKFVDHFVSQHLGLNLDKKKCPICKHAFSIYCGVSTLMSHEFRKRLYRHCIEWHDFTGLEGGEDGAFKCDKCTAYFRKNIQLLQHTDEVHDSNCQTNSCEDCGKNFEATKILREHRRKVHKVELKHACGVSECDKKFETLKELIYHNTRVHFDDTTGKTKFNCDKCEKKYFTKIALLAHLKCHTCERIKHVCEQCGKSFRDKTHLVMHYKFHEGPESWDFACEICDKKIFSQQKLTEHMRVHTKEKPFVCQVCGVAYGHRHNLRIHVNSKHKEIQDIPRKCTTTNFASTRKGKKIK